MREVLPWLPIVLAVLLLPFFLAPPLCAEEEPAAGEDEAEDEPTVVEPLTPEEARRLAKLLERAAKRRKPEEVLPVLDEVADRSDASFHKPLIKMLTHVSSKVGVRAADALYAQVVESEKERLKLAKNVWKNGWSHRTNNRRYTVRCRALLAVAKLEGEKLETKRFKELLRLWRSVIGDPQVANAPALVSVCEYVRLTKDKRMCRLLAEEIDAPQATAVNSPSNPPAEWWERRWKMWKPVKAEVVETLEELTEQSFKDTASAKAWFLANEKEFGFRW